MKTNNPRENAHYRPRGPRKFSYTYADIADLVGLKPKTVQNHVNLGKFDPSSLASVVAYVESYTGGRAMLIRNATWKSVKPEGLEARIEYEKRTRSVYDGDGPGGTLLHAAEDFEAIVLKARQYIEDDDIGDGIIDVPGLIDILAAQ